MSQQKVYFKNTTNHENYEALKLQLGSLRGVIDMDIDSQNQGVCIDFDDTFVTRKQLKKCLADIGYELS